mmetsp:Transcript_4809/g.14168  ORF Transcript_4809/g.14168 Transcript_4809/m.14168 type:complete len:335 (-) Transcript_4809:845-1849(-)|eukprot:CAMPEP_0206039952 /NCGR_PEP_ID=MMETSP1466-20131121/5079_1 /ASSEMBLY_ACC=CAM_ASM_001126 /TAXON_ID=44452 /ORGANISM="Pavlova gyrans, Strain CCMP608" /LENGTH=334 /DNA_ID=CAMNT_0053414611 /DNA_START=266 /DNA_END=1270 /DNA_ORIENTATION=+
MNTHLLALALALACGAPHVHAFYKNITADAFVTSKLAPEITANGPEAIVTAALPVNSHWRSVYGTRTFSTGDGIIRWFVKVIRPHDNIVNAWDYALGVAMNDAHADFMFWENSHGIAYFAQSGHTTCYGERNTLATFDDGDIIQIDLDTNVGSISFAKNGEELSVAHTGFPTSGSWRVAAAFTSKDYGAVLTDAQGNPLTEAPVIQTAANIGGPASGSGEGSGDGGGGGGNGGSNGKEVALEGASTTTISAPMAAVAGAIVGSVMGSCILMAIALLFYRKCVVGNRYVEGRVHGAKVKPASRAQSSPNVAYEIALSQEEEKLPEGSTPRGSVGI